MDLSDSRFTGEDNQQCLVVPGAPRNRQRSSERTHESVADVLPDTLDQVIEHSPLLPVVALLVRRGD
ncbi:hypothetical protein G6F61_014845 [Rhizopus arrhizus]|nr:hypothetical protein G6F61_014845 [Rhizopus arrhizus]